MMKYLVVLATSIAVMSCKSSVDSSNSIVGSWSVTDYQLEVSTKMSETEYNSLQESIKRQARKLIEFAEFHFNENGTYHLVYSPMDFDKGQWQISQDTLLIYKSQIYNAVDTSIIHFSNKDEAEIRMTEAEQVALVSIKRK